MRKSRWLPVGALAATAALVLTACGGGDNNNPGQGSGEVDPNGSLSVYGTEPQNALLPTNTAELGGGKAIRPLFTSLVEYRGDTGAPYNAMAESITTSDAKVYNVKIKQGWKFHDGTEVKAKNFVDAWNWGAYAPNGQIDSSFFTQIQGFDDVNPGEGKQPTADKMSGLKLIGDYEFEITLKAPFSVFPTKVGYDAFSPLPDSFFKDPKAFESNPIGNGPAKFVSRTPNVEIKLTRFDEYQGEDKLKFKDLNIKIYSSQETAYLDLLSGKLDFMEAIPPSYKVGGKYKQDLGDNLIEGNLLNISTLAVPYYLPAYNNLDLRKAISLAINREQITQTVLNDTYVPLGAWVAPGIEGYRADTCGEFCKYDPVKAKEYFAKSGFTGTLTIASNEDGGRKEPLEAACNSIKNALGVECNFIPSTNFGQFRSIVTSEQLTGMGRSDWVADYPSIENFFNPIYKTGAGSNDSRYSSPATDGLLVQADSTADKAEAIKIYQQAEDQVAKDLPNIPVWAEKGVGGKSDRLITAKLDFRRHADYSAFEVRK